MRLPVPRRTRNPSVPYWLLPGYDGANGALSERIDPETIAGARALLGEPWNNNGCLLQLGRIPSCTDNRTLYCAVRPASPLRRVPGAAGVEPAPTCFAGRPPGAALQGGDGVVERAAADDLGRYRDLPEALFAPPKEQMVPLTLGIMAVFNTARTMPEPPDPEVTTGQIPECIGAGLEPPPEEREICGASAWQLSSRTTDLSLSGGSSGERGSVAQESTQLKEPGPESAAVTWAAEAAEVPREVKKAAGMDGQVSIGTSDSLLQVCHTLPVAF